VKVAILQSNYIPWKGYFDIIQNVDLFIFHDDIQYTKSDWRNRNKIKSAGGLKWITIPCGTDEHRLICDVKLPDTNWQEKHWNMIKSHYRKSTFYSYYYDFFDEVYTKIRWKYLFEINQYIIKKISTEIFGLKTKFDDSRNYNLKNSKAERVIELLEKVNATSYLSGPSAKSYLNNSLFLKKGINLEWMNYNGYPEYPQFYPPFAHHVSIIDLLFHTGPNAKYFIQKK